LKNRYKIPPNPPFKKGGEVLLPLKKEETGRFNGVFQSAKVLRIRIERAELENKFQEKISH